VSMDGGPRGAGAGPWPEGFRAAVALTFEIADRGNGGNRSRAGPRLR
jgi:hypothetical protein